MPKELSAEVWGMMKANGIRQKELAERMGVTQQYLSMVFNGKKGSEAVLERIRRTIQEICDSRK